MKRVCILRFFATGDQRLLRARFGAVRSLLYKRMLRALAQRIAFNRECIVGKGIIIVGPAAGVENELCHCRCEDYDVVVRMNRGVHLASDSSNGVGTRTDILFHNFKEEGDRSAGQLSPQLLAEQGVKVVVYTHAGASYVPFIALAMMRFRRLRSAADFRLVNPDLYASVSAAMGSFAPLTGTVALALIVACRPKRLAVVGFSFFQTQYHGAYGPDVGPDRAPLDWARDGGSHEPNRDRDFVRSLLSRAAQDGLEVHLGHNVARHLDLRVDARPAPSAQSA